ncbi:MAG: LD-carboxypeptidase [Limisphaera sp.]
MRTLQLLRPPRLEPGDLIGLAAPASPLPQPADLDRAVARLEALGFRILPARHLLRRRGYLAGTDRERAADLHQLARHRKVKAIVSLRGGYGCARLLQWFDPGLFRAHPKIVVGYSDLTALHCALLTHARLVTFHGPMAVPDFARPDLPDFTIRSFLRLLTRSEPYGSVRDHCPAPAPRILRPGRAVGPLLGGNLTVLVSTLGTPWQPDFRGRVLLLEEVGEPPYRVDRLLTQLLNAGLLQQVAGIAIGTCERCEDPWAPTSSEPRPTLEDVWKDRLGPLRKPVVIGLPFGHTPGNATLPLGVRAELDAKRGDLILLEPAVA